MKGAIEVTTDHESESPIATKDAANWAPLVERLKVGGMPAGAPDLVQGRRVQGPLQGFGKMWQKTYRARLDGSDVTPAEAIGVLKERFGELWPKGARFYAPLSGIAPGEVALLSVSAGPVRLSSGVLVLYADEESFTLMSPEGHMLSGWITFNAFQETGCTVVQCQVLMRAPDPLAELGLNFGGHKAEDRQWVHTLTALGSHFGLTATVDASTACVDPRRNWSQAKNILHNAGIRSLMYSLSAPARWLHRPAGAAK
jgi:hypothetical protein